MLSEQVFAIPLFLWQMRKEGNPNQVTKHYHRIPCNYGTLNSSPPRQQPRNTMVHKVVHSYTS